MVVPSDNGYQASSGIRSMVSPNVELKGAVEYLDFGSGDNTTSYVVGSAFNVNKKFAVYTDAKFDKDATRYGVGLRYNF